MENQIDDEVNLDDLLTMESEVLEPDSDYHPDMPYIQVDRNEFLRVLKLLNSFPAKSTVLFAIGTEGDELFVYGTNKDAVCHCKLKILNEDHYVIPKPIFLDLNRVMAFVSSYTRFQFAFDEQGKVFFTNSTASIGLEVYSLDFDSVKEDIKEPEDSWTFPLPSHIVKAFITGFECSFKLSDNKLLITSDGAESFFTLYKMNYNQDTGLPAEDKVIIRRFDLPSIKQVVDYNCSFGYTKDRIFFYFDLGMISFLRLPYEESQFKYPDTLASGDELGQIQFNIKLLRQAAKLATTLSSSIVDFVCEGSKVYMDTGSAKFYVGDGKLTESFSISLEIFGKLVGIFDVSNVIVDVLVTEKGIEIREGNSSVYSLSRTSVNAQKRRDKINEKINNRVSRKANLAEKGKLVDNVAENMQAGQSMADLFGED